MARGAALLETIDVARQFISERIMPVDESMDTRHMARGEPGLPARFRWRDAEVEIDAVLETWTEMSDCHHGSAEQYVRKHWYRVHTTAGDEMRLYFERQARSARQRKARWWLYTVTSAGEGEQ